MTIPKISLCTSDHNTSKRTGAIEYVAVHYTAGWDSSAGKAKDNALYYAVAKEQASADFFVDEGGIVQYNPAPEKRYCWAVGAKKADKSQGGGSLFGIAKNANVISVELCSRNSTGMAGNPNDPGYSIAAAVLTRGAELVRYLMAEWDIPIKNLIRHFDVTGKLCPGVIGWNEPSGSTAIWQRFRTLAQTPVATVERFNAVCECPDWSKSTLRKLCDAGYIQGNGGAWDVNGRPADMDLSMEMIRTLVINDRAGVYG